MGNYLLATLSEQSDHIWYTENPDTVGEKEIEWVQSFWNLWPEEYHFASGFVSF